MDSLTRKTFVPQASTTVYRGLGAIREEDEKKESSLYYPGEEIKGGNAPAQPRAEEEVKGDQRPNTNVMAINFAEIEKANFMATGDPVRCEKCLAYLNQFSVYDRPIKTWLCDFCEFPNVISVDEEEIPKNEIVTYVDPNQEEEAKIPAGGAVTNSSGTSIIFCIDISASMATTSEFTGKMKYMNTENRISRLECVKIAVDDQLHNLATNSPDVKVGFILFGEDVFLLGDGTTANHKFDCDLNDYDAVATEAQSLGDRYLTKPLHDTFPFLMEQLEKIDTRGSTALGPSLLASVTLIGAKGRPGSKVILCTDGQANTGIGQVSIHGLSDDYVSQSMYNRIGDQALQKGIIISLVSLAEEDCRLDILAPCAMKTGGNIVKINPKELSTGFSAFLEEKIIAFEATMAVKLHRSMKFVTVNPEDLGPDPSVLVRKLGNVTPNIVFTFEYEVKSNAELKKEKINLGKLTTAPFQALMNYIGPDGFRYCKVISKRQDVTHRNEEAAREVNVNVLTAHSMRKTADYALKGRMQDAIATTHIYRSLVRGQKEEEANYDNSLRPIANSVEHEAATVAFRHGYRSDHLVATVAHTQKFIHGKPPNIGPPKPI